MVLRHFGFATCAAGAMWLQAPCVQAQVSGEKVKIGVLADMSGLYSDLSGIGSVVATQMAAEDFGGSVLGKKIEVVSADHQNKPDIGSNIARHWIDRKASMPLSTFPCRRLRLRFSKLRRKEPRSSHLVLRIFRFDGQILLSDQRALDL